MVYFNRFLGWMLVGLLGLTSFTASAVQPVYLDEGLARNSCATVRSNAKAAYSNANWSFRQESLYDVCTTAYVNSSTQKYFVPAVQLCSKASYPTGNCPTSGASVDICSSTDCNPYVTSISPVRVAFSTENSSCSARPSLYDTIRAPTPNGTGVVCDLGCSMLVAIASTPPYYDASPTGSTCIVGQGGAVSPESVNTTDVDEDGQPNTTDPCPLDPANSCDAADSDGDGIPNGSDACPDDPDNLCPAGDADGDGSPNSDDPCPSDPGNECSGTGDPDDPDGDGTAGGGFTCSEPPVCAGDAIQCAMLYQQWHTKCKVESGNASTKEGLEDVKDAIDGLGDGIDGVKDSVDGVKDSVDGLGSKVDGVGDKVTGLRGDLAGFASDGGVTNGAGLSELGGLFKTKTIGTSSINSSGLGFSRQCPMWNDISFSIGASAVTIPLSTFTIHCQIFEWTGLLIVAFSAYVSIRILLRGD